METIILLMVVVILAFSCVLFLAILRSMKGELRDGSAIQLEEQQAPDITTLPPGMAPRLRPLPDATVTPNAGFES